VGFEVDEEESEGVRVLSRKEGCTLFMTLLAAFQVLLFYYSKQEEIVVGTNVANRNRAEIEGLIGFFVNTLALRTDLAGNPTFRELLGRVRGVALEAYAHQEVPFEKLVAALQLERDLSRSPVFQVKFEFGSDPHMKSNLDGLTLRPLDFGSDVVRYDLHLFVRERGEMLTGKMVYDVALFNAATVEMMTKQLTSLLRAVIAEPDTRLDALARMLAAQEREHQAEQQREYEESIGMRFKRVRRRSVGEDARLEV
jgi:non-ribosomal peptide synthetase component F